MNTFITKLKQGAESIFSKIGLISARLHSYIAIAITFGDKMLMILDSGTGSIVIEDVLKEIGITDPNLVEDVIAAITKAIGYLTQSQAILGAGTPDQVLNTFLTDMKTDAAGLQKSKVWTLLEQTIANLDNNSKLGNFYRWILAHYSVGTELGAIDAPVANTAKAVSVTS